MHRRQRRLIQPAFHPTRFPGYAQIMTKHIDGITTTWADGQVLDIVSEMATLTARIAVETMFSDALPPATLQAMRNNLHALWRASTHARSSRHRWMHSFLPRTVSTTPAPTCEKSSAA
jgi:cytochrome P450